MNSKRIYIDITDTSDKLESIREYFGEDAEIYKYEGNENEYIIDTRTYFIFDEQEREEFADSYIIDGLWTIKSSILSFATGISEKVFETLSELHEEANEAILSIVERTCGIGLLKEDVLAYGGYGELISGYDGEEIELLNEFYAYQQ